MFALNISSISPMYPVHVVSLYNGWEKLLEENNNEWQGIQKSLELMTPQFIQDPKNLPISLRGSNKSTIRQLSYIWDRLIQRQGWRPNVSLNETDRTQVVMRRMRNRVAVRMLVSTAKGGNDFANFMYVDAAMARKAGLCDNFVLLVPVDEVAEAYENGQERVYDIFSESICRSQLTTLLSLHTGSSFVIVFFSAHKEELSIEHISVNSGKSGIPFIEQYLEFTPETAQAGISVLSYFSEVLRQKYPDLNAKVRIEQQGTTVLMHVELPSGEINTIKRDLINYFLVVSKQVSPDVLFDNPYQILALESKLEIANMELRIANKLNAQLTKDIDRLDASYERLEKSFNQQLASHAEQIINVTQAFTQQSASYERVQLAQMNQANIVFKELSNEAQGNQIVLNAIHSLEYNLISGISTIDIQDQVKHSLSVIQGTKPTLLAKVTTLVENSGYGVLGNIVFEWIKQQ